VTDVRFPESQYNEDASGVVATWYVADGEQVADGQLLAEVQLDKASFEVPAPCAGTVHLLVGEDAEVTPGAVIARID
jgi:pyruvate/2-oxoglutarate dehydrogenase complex dihydrolipoamide acyltransferase (E2) component